MDDKILKEDKKLFEAMAENLQGCMSANEEEKGFFDCNGCENIGKCFKTLSESVAAISFWLSKFIKGKMSGTDDLTNIFKKIKGVKEESEDCGYYT